MAFSKRSFFVFAFFLFVLWHVMAIEAATSCNNTTSTCEDMCSHVYDSCSMTLVNSSGISFTETECVSACASTDATVVSCLSSASCTATAIDSCLTYGATSSTDTDSTYIGGGGVEDSNGATTSGGACGEITDCNSCVSNCRCRYDGTVAASTCCTGCGCECELFCMPTDWWVATCL